MSPASFQLSNWWHGLGNMGHAILLVLAVIIVAVIFWGWAGGRRG